MSRNDRCSWSHVASDITRFRDRFRHSKSSTQCFQCLLSSPNIECVWIRPMLIEHTGTFASWHEQFQLERLSWTQAALQRLLPSSHPCRAQTCHTLPRRLLQVSSFANDPSPCTEATWKVSKSREILFRFVNKDDPPWLKKMLFLRMRDNMVFAFPCGKQPIHLLTNHLCAVSYVSAL